MSIGILGKKLGMSQFFDDQGRAIPVTLIEAGPCRITQLKTSDIDGYAAVQIGFGDTREKLINKPSKGHLTKSGEVLLKHLREYRVEGLEGLELGAAITVGSFEADAAEHVLCLPRRIQNLGLLVYRETRHLTICLRMVL